MLPHVKNALVFTDGKREEYFFFLSSFGVLSWAGLKAVVGWIGFVLFRSLHLLPCKLCKPIRCNF